MSVTERPSLAPPSGPLGALGQRAGRNWRRFLFGEAERIDTPRNRPLRVDICLPLLRGCLSAG